MGGKPSFVSTTTGHTPGTWSDVLHSASDLKLRCSSLRYVEASESVRFIVRRFGSKEVLFRVDFWRCDGSRHCCVFLMVEAMFLCNASSKQDISCVMNFRMSTMSLTVALLLPRNCRTTSMKSGKVSGMSPFRPKMKSAKSTRPTTSTPTSCKARAASGISSSRSNSSFVMIPSPSLSRPLLTSIDCIFSLTNVSMAFSFSMADTTVTTSHKIPISIFIRDNETRSTNKKSTKP
mmetsp:Transcript_50030/g.92405  ORF Transcript_50030/g.92405 Transcript_50030/m.92405 type:complete len:234 (+) Transcript_50030:1-702(+)